MAQLAKKAITESFIKLVSQKPLDKVTVKDIVDDCGITRTAFYYHFTDTYAVLDEILMSQADKLTEDFVGGGSFRDSVLYAINFVEMNKNTITHIYNSPRRKELSAILEKALDAVAHSYMAELSRRYAANDRDTETLGRCSKWLFTGLLRDWLEGRLTEQPQELADKVLQLFENMGAQLSKKD